jgi:hypothetical protein
MPAPKELSALVEHFRRNRETYRAPGYKEASLRREFVDPFFELLGWDLQNRNRAADAYKDVVHEDSLKMGGLTKAPDYSFRVGGTRKFFVETKKPLVSVKDDPDPAYQLRRYAWTAHLPLSILTDFEEFAVYDCRVRPDRGDKASAARLLYLTFDEYPARWDEIAGVFSKDAVLQGAFDRFAGEGGGRKGTAEVDDAFLAEIEDWRLHLAKNLALRNPRLSVDDLNFAVQKIIDRIVFLRICEDRGIENDGQLLALVSGPRAYPRLVEIFEKADRRYNSGLFHFSPEKGQGEEPDRLTPGLKLDDDVLKDILRRLYYPDCPYEFSVFPVEVLGQVYEQFLGRVIRLTGGHHAKVEEKPEVRKAGGVFYTPSWVVDYIVKTTVGKLLADMTPREAARLRIVDPACGSGSFLLGAYGCLLAWHLERYLAEGAEKHAKGKDPALYRTGAGEWRLNTAEKKRILLNGIFGVDLDPQAVEVTKLSLLLKVLEGETGVTLSLFAPRERALPDLGNNIKCGNSLIASDVRDGVLFADASPEEEKRINAFDWQREFPQVFKAGGFDAVIGNPPYVRQESLGEQKDYFAGHYRVYHGVADLYAYFIEKGVNLLRPGGYFSYIVANKWMRANYGEPLRRWLKDQGLEEIIDFGDLPVFRDATTYPCIIRVRKGKPGKSFDAVKLTTLDFPDLAGFVRSLLQPVKLASLEDGGWSLAGQAVSDLLKKIRSKGVPLGEYVGGRIFYGIKTGLNEAFVIDDAVRRRLVREDKKSAEIIKPFLAGRDIKRYQTPTSDKFLIFTRRGIRIKDYPAIEEHLRQFRTALIPKPAGWKEKKGEEWPGRKPGSYEWYEIQDTVDYWQEFEKPKIFFPDISDRPNYTLDEDGFYGANTCYLISAPDKYLLGVLNSRLMNFFYRNHFSVYRGGYIRFFSQYVEMLPIPRLDLSDPTDKSRHDRMVKLVTRMLDLSRRRAAATTPTEAARLDRDLAATDGEIDELVYELYRLTREEVRLLEDQDGGKTP